MHFVKMNTKPTKKMSRRHKNNLNLQNPQQCLLANHYFQEAVVVDNFLCLFLSTPKLNLNFANLRQFLGTTSTLSPVITSLINEVFKQKSQWMNGLDFTGDNLWFRPPSPIIQFSSVGTPQQAPEPSIIFWVIMNFNDK